MTSKSTPKAKPVSPARRSSSVQHTAEPPAQISGGWLLRALGISLLGAALCGYLSLCLLFYQGQWQVVFHPSRSITTTPANFGIRFDEVRFDATESGMLQLDGWWIPAEPASRYANSTLLYFHDSKGSLSQAAGELKALHDLGINVFAFDYRGYGRSIETHPSEERVYQDADAAWNYLTDTRHLDSRSIVLFGDGLGATIAAETAVRHASASGLVLEDPAPAGLALIQADPRTKLLPVRLLFHDRFDLDAKLRGLKMPKLILSTGSHPDSNHRSQAAFQAAVEPKEYFEIAAAGSSAQGLPGYLESLRRFLDQQLHLD
jgi:uncharacterized protein